jgi:DNA-binding XRE family transcriptional regulator
VRKPDIFPIRKFFGFKMSNDLAAEFGLMVRTKRRAMKMKQDELALVSGVGVRFIHDLEAGKPSCQLGKALAVGRVLGISIVDSKGAEVQGKTL